MSFVFLGLHFRHREVPRLGVKLELQLPTTATATATASVIYTTAHCNAGSLTHWARPWIEPASSWMLVRFISTESQWEPCIFHFQPEERWGWRVRNLVCGCSYCFVSIWTSWWCVYQETKHLAHEDIYTGTSSTQGDMLQRNLQGWKTSADGKSMVTYSVTPDRTLYLK